ncbi:gas vesicle protein GvpG [Micromonospora sp. WP24]|uniref:gas vesicle protein GvpG n=1 Tax=Micromonospora sp. WP24 TaxID=2604469 RepID=UPI001CA33D93|nr:gas vesicle protein GvpG [Micromonospora sp. WP24]
MDILLSLLTLPYAPVRGLTAVLRVIAREAESQLYSPVNIRRELEELDAAAAAGEISPQERDQRQQQVLERLTGAPVRQAPAASEGGSPTRRQTDGGAPVVRRNGPARRRGDAAGPRGGRPRPAAEPARRAEAERRRDGGGGVRDGADSRRRRPNTPT